MTVQSPSPGVATPGHRGLHPMWIGAIALAMLTSSLLVLFGYSVFHLPWLDRFGPWNIWVGAGLAIGTTIPLRLWTTSAHKA
jgi:hypothetical protein